MSDWLKLHRSIVESRVFSDAFLVQLWVWCLVKANWKVGWYQDREIEPGQFATGRLNAANELQTSGSKWYRGMLRLAEFGNIKLENVNNRFTVVTIVNWRTYQDSDREPEQLVNNWRTTGEQPVNNCRTTGEHNRRREERKKERKEEGKKHTGEVAAQPSRSAEVFAHYRALHPRAKLGDDVRKKINARLREGFTVQDLKDAIDGNHNDPHCCGENASGKKYHSLELIVRNSSNVTKYSEIGQNGLPSRVAQAYLTSREVQL